MSEQTESDDVTGDATGDGATGDGAIGYAAAFAELEQILDELEDDEIDVDVLAERVARAAELIRVCRGRIASAQMNVEQIVADLEQLAHPDDD